LVKANGGLYGTGYKATEDDIAESLKKKEIEEKIKKADKGVKEMKSEV
jgi:hypothetical protein